MTANFDLTSKLPARRAKVVRFDYPPGAFIITCSYVETVVLQDADDRERELVADNVLRAFDIETADLGRAVPLVHLQTGAPTGETITVYQILQGITSLVREHQAPVAASPAPLPPAA